MGIGKDRTNDSNGINSNYWSRHLKATNDSKPTIFKQDTNSRQKPIFVSQDVKNFFSFNRHFQGKNSVTYDLNSIDNPNS